MQTQKEFQDFLRKNINACRLAEKASEDYLLARLGISNALWSGFEMTTQATEKLLKSYLLFADLSLKGDQDQVRRVVSTESNRKYERGHDVEACLSLASKNGFSSSADILGRIKRINEYYSERYNRRLSLGTNELKDVDEVIFEIWDAFEIFNEDYFYRCGIMHPVYSELDHSYHGMISQGVQKKFQIMTDHNSAYNARKLKLEKGILSRLDAREKSGFKNDG